MPSEPLGPREVGSHVVVVTLSPRVAGLHLPPRAAWHPQNVASWIVLSTHACPRDLVSPV